MMRRMLRYSLGVILVLGAIAPISAAPDATAVADAAMHHDAGAVKDLLVQGADVNAAQGDGMTALHWAAIDGDADLVRMLLYAGAIPEATTRIGAYTPLHMAARQGRAAVVDALLSGGAQADVRTASGTTPLMLAAGAGSAAAVTVLLDHGADVNAWETAKGETALMFAAAYNRADVIDLLLRRGANPAITSTVLNWTALPKSDLRLPYAAFAKAFGVKLPGSTPEADPTRDAVAAEPSVAAEEPSTAPAHEESAAATPAEASKAPAPTATGSKGKAAGAGIGKPDANAAAAFLQFIGAYVKLVGTQGGLTALQFATRQGNAAATRALLDGGADVNQADPGDHTTPLLSAIINGHFDLAEELLARGADPNAAQVNGVTPLYAALNCVWASHTLYPQPTAYRQQTTTYLQLMQDLLDRGATPNPRLAEKVWYSEYNFDLSGVDESGATPFWRAAYADDVEAMKLLVAHGADPALATKKPNTPALGGSGNFTKGPEVDPSGRPPVAVGGPDVSPLLAASGQGYGLGFAANSHRFAPTGMLSAVKYLVEVLHADVNEADADGNTVLHNAAARGDNAMILYLVSRGADVKAVNRKGQTIADMANGPVERISPFPETIALVERLGGTLAHKCISCG